MDEVKKYGKTLEEIEGDLMFGECIHLFQKLTKHL